MVAGGSARAGRRRVKKEEALGGGTAAGDTALNSDNLVPVSPHELGGEGVRRKKRQAVEQLRETPRWILIVLLRAAPRQLAGEGVRRKKH